MVVHLSGVEHRLVRSHGYEKGLALTNKTSTHALQMILRRHEVCSFFVAALVLRQCQSFSSRALSPVKLDDPLFFNNLYAYLRLGLRLTASLSL
jgi:hypothetical protein